MPGYFAHPGVPGSPGRSSRICPHLPVSACCSKPIAIRRCSPKRLPNCRTQVETCFTTCILSPSCGNTGFRRFAHATPILPGFLRSLQSIRLPGSATINPARPGSPARSNWICSCWRKITQDITIQLTYGSLRHKLPYMIKRQVYFQEEEFALLQQTAKSSGRSVADLVREAVRRVWLDSEPKGPVALWDGPVRIPSTEHDSIYDRPE